MALAICSHYKSSNFTNLTNHAVGDMNFYRRENKPSIWPNSYSLHRFSNKIYYL